MMGIIDSAMRKKLPAGEFGLPAERKYPMPDKTHAVAAKSRATQQYKRGSLSASQRSRINAKANKVLKKKP